MKSRLFALLLLAVAVPAHAQMPALPPFVPITVTQQDPRLAAAVIHECEPSLALEPSKVSKPLI